MSEKIGRRGFIKLSGAALFAASIFRVDKLGIFEPQYSPVVVTVKDVMDAREFFTHFEIPMSKELSDVFKSVERAGIVTPKSQHELKIAVCKEILFNRHAAFSDKMFKGVRDECEEVIS